MTKFTWDQDTDFGKVAGEVWATPVDEKGVELHINPQEMPAVIKAPLKLLRIGTGKLIKITVPRETLRAAASKLNHWADLPAEEVADA